eukprot:scaffold85422_cov28-Prasinocladus_malaysianus.AAC.1
MKDGTATIMKMWREISGTVSPLQVALARTMAEYLREGNLDPQMLITLMMKRAEKDDRDTRSKAQPEADGETDKIETQAGSAKPDV